VGWWCVAGKEHEQKDRPGGRYRSLYGIQDPTELVSISSQIPTSGRTMQTCARPSGSVDHGCCSSAAVLSVLLVTWYWKWTLGAHANLT
jgi:hypothetical protein